MKWGVTGASGQLGSELEVLLNSRGAPAKFWHDGELDITANSGIDSIIETKPDVLINCAAWTAVDRAETEELTAFRVNETGASNMALAARELQIPFVQISTDYVFAGDRNYPWRTNDPTEPKSAYGRSKLAGEVAVTERYPERSYILRTAWLYGRYGQNFPKAIMRRILNSSDELKVVDDQFGQPTSAKDLAAQIVSLIENELPVGVYHATNSGMTSWFEFSQHILKLMGAPANRISPIPSSGYPTAAIRPKFSVLDHSEWNLTKVPPMRDWKSAFDANFADLLESVKVDQRDV